MMFDHYKIPRENLLNRTGDVAPDGKYVSPFKDPNKRFGNSILIDEEKHIPYLSVHCMLTILVPFISYVIDKIYTNVSEIVFFA